MRLVISGMAGFLIFFLWGRGGGSMSLDHFLLQLSRAFSGVGAVCVYIWDIWRVSRMSCIWCMPKIWRA